MAKQKISFLSLLLELFVVIIGISIAFWIEKAAADRSKKQEELLHLKGVEDDLKTDLKVFEEYIGYGEATLGYIDRLNQLIREKDKNNDSLNYLMLRAGWISNHDPRDITYQSMKSSGALEQITNFELRRSLVYHYEQRVSNVHFMNELHERHLNEYVTPMLIRYTDFTSGNPVDPAIFRSREVINIFAGLQGQISNKINRYRGAVGHTSELLEEVQAEIGKF